MRYIDEARRQLEQARDAIPPLPRGASDQERLEVARLRLGVADRLIQLAAIEKGLQPPSLVLHPQDGA